MYMMDDYTNTTGQKRQILQKRYTSTQSDEITMSCKDYAVRGASKSQSIM